MVTNAALIFSTSLLFHPEDGGSRIFQEIGTHLPDYVVSCQEAFIFIGTTVRTSTHTKDNSLPNCRRLILFGDEMKKHEMGSTRSTNVRKEKFINFVLRTLMEETCSQALDQL
jgi:hypothetical protein